jgi:putative colanic acid biosynthesis acetyltransferase WcaF
MNSNGVPRVDGDVPMAADPSPYTLREKLGRVAWAIVQATAFRWSFHSWYGWRRRLLLLFGASLHPTCRIRRTVTVECPWNLSIGVDSSVGDGAILYCLGPVRIGDHSTISQRAHLCAGSHDHRSRRMVLLRPPITIGSDCWIAAEAFVGPGITVGDGVILGARAVAFKDLAPWMVYLGNPAQPVAQRSRLRPG